MVDLGTQAVELAAKAGLKLDDWQERILRASLEQTGDKWTHFEVAAIVPRQCGKGAILEARELAGLFLDDSCRLIVHSAHEFGTSLEAFRRLLDLILDTPELACRIKRVARSHGEEGIELLDGSRIRFKTRTKGGGRGLSADLLILDEAMIIPEFAFGALLPTLAARPNPQMWLTGSAVDQTVHEHGLVLARVRERGQAGDAGLAYFEYCADLELDDVLRNPELLEDQSHWAKANPAFGIRISAEHIERERLSLDPRTLATERLNIGDWPITDPRRASLISAQLWASLHDPESSALDPIRFAFDVTPNRSHAVIAAAGKREDGLIHVEVIEHKDGTGWLTERLRELLKKHEGSTAVCDPAGPAGSLLAQLAEAGVAVATVTAQEHAQACGAFFDAVGQERVRHLGTPELSGAIAGAATRPLGEAWAWARKKSSIDISPLVAVTLAAAQTSAKPASPFMFAFG